MKIHWKKIAVSFLLISTGCILYLIFSFGSVAYIWFFSLIAHIILSILFVWKNYKKFFIIGIFFLLLIQSFILFTNFPKCDLHYKGGWVSYCECFGVKKTMLGSSQCIGKRSVCYTFNANKEIIWVPLLGEEIDSKKIEISCAEIDKL